MANTFRGTSSGVLDSDADLDLDMASNSSSRIRPGWLAGLPGIVWSNMSQDLFHPFFSGAPKDDNGDSNNCNSNNNSRYKNYSYDNWDPSVKLLWAIVQVI